MCTRFQEWLVSRFSFIIKNEWFSLTESKDICDCGIRKIQTILRNKDCDRKKWDSWERVRKHSSRRKEKKWINRDTSVGVKKNSLEGVFRPKIYYFHSHSKPYSYTPLKNAWGMSSLNLPQTLYTSAFLDSERT